MILTYDQCKWLATKIGGEHKQFEFTGKGKATAKEIEELKELDDFQYDVFGYHLITNYEDLK